MSVCAKVAGIVGTAGAEEERKKAAFLLIALEVVRECIHTRTGVGNVSVVVAALPSPSMSSKTGTGRVVPSQAHTFFLSLSCSIK